MKNNALLCTRKINQYFTNIMTTATHTELQQIAKQASAYITRLKGECDTFQIDGATISAVIAYEAEISEDEGDYWTAPSWWIEWETVSVEGVYDEDGNNDTEAAEWLAKQLN